MALCRWVYGALSTLSASPTMYRTHRRCRVLKKLEPFHCPPFYLGRIVTIDCADATRMIPSTAHTNCQLSVTSICHWLLPQPFYICFRPSLPNTTKSLDMRIIRILAYSSDMLNYLFLIIKPKNIYNCLLFIEHYLFTLNLELTFQCTFHKLIIFSVDVQM
jgi:hypothetical protein